jgi:hypothetical protein
LEKLKKSEEMIYWILKKDANQQQEQVQELPVSKSLKLSSILFWKSEDDGEILRNLLRWRLGRIAFHQECLN